MHAETETFIGEIDSKYNVFVIKFHHYKFCSARDIKQWYLKTGLKWVIAVCRCKLDILTSKELLVIVELLVLLLICCLCLLGFFKNKNFGTQV